jgi:hypothetical protein
MVRYAKFRFIEVKDVLVRPGLPPRAAAKLYPFRPRAGSRVARHRDPTCVRRRRRRSTAPPLALYDFFESIRRTISGYSHVSTSRVHVVFDQVSFDDPSPNSSRTHTTGPPIFKYFLNPHADRPVETPAGALIRRSTAASAVRAFISREGVLRGLSGRPHEAREFRGIADFHAASGLPVLAAMG